MGQFDGKVAIVTGGGSGLGEAIGKRSRPVAPVWFSRTLTGRGAERVAGEIEAAGGRASAFEQDTARPADSDEVVKVSPLVGFLLSDEASFITGGYYLVDGGYTAV